MAAPQRSRFIILFWRLHRWLFTASDGRLGTSLMGHKILKLVTTGHRSGKPRTILIYYFDYQDSYVIVASNLGADYHPAWYRNLQANSEAEIQIGRERMQVTARTAEGEERARLWAFILEKEPSYEEYRAATERIIPLVILDPDKPTA